MKERRQITKRQIKNELKWYTFILPGIICLLVLTYIPTLMSLKYSFYKVSVLGFGEEFIGIKNYITLLTSQTFQKAIYNTVVLALIGLIGIPLGFILAVLINNLGRGKLQSFFRIGFYLPNIITGVSVILIFQAVLRQHGGLLNSVLSAILGRNIEIGWLVDSDITKIGISLMSIWSGLGYTMLINLAGLQSISKEIYEASTVDGCSGFQQVKSITIPLMKNTFVFLLITNIIGAFSRFTDLYILSGNSASGRPGGSLQTILMYIYQFSFETPNYGISSAGAMILFVIIFIITFVELKMTGFLKS